MRPRSNLGCGRTMRRLCRSCLDSRSSGAITRSGVGARSISLLRKLYKQDAFASAFVCKLPAGRSCCAGFGQATFVFGSPMSQPAHIHSCPVSDERHLHHYSRRLPATRMVGGSRPLVGCTMAIGFCVLGYTRCRRNEHRAPLELPEVLLRFQRVMLMWSRWHASEGRSSWRRR
jgi:hypothetical protein